MSLSAEDISNLRYFGLERGDVTRWVDWHDKLDEIKKAYPEIAYLVEQIEINERLLKAALQSLQDPS